MGLFSSKCMFIQNAPQKWKWKKCKTQQVCEAPQREHKLQLYTIFKVPPTRNGRRSENTRVSGGGAAPFPPTPSSFILSGSLFIFDPYFFIFLILSPEEIAAFLAALWLNIFFLIPIFFDPPFNFFDPY